MNATTPIVKRRACVACTNSKAKCTPTATQQCQRCVRLGKQCTYLDLPQTKRKYKVAPSRVEVLEKKVEQLVSQLAASTQQNQTTSSDASHPLTNDSRSSNDAYMDSTDISTLLDAAQDPFHGPDIPTNSVLAGQPSVVDRGLLSETEAERLVKVFQLDFVPKFPFVLIEHGETVAHFRQKEPFLFLCVMAATMSSSHPLRKVVADEIMKHVTLRIVAGSERNFELLRGLLVNCAGYTYPAEKRHPRLLLLTQLCVSVLHDLDLQSKQNPNPDEQRAILGSYWLSASLCGTLARPFVMRRNARIDECLQFLMSTKKLSDRWIAPFIHIQTFVGTIDDTYTSMRERGGGDLIQVMRGSLERHFDDVKVLVERDLCRCPSSTEGAIRTDIKYVEMRLEELSLRGELWVSEPASAYRITMLMGLVQRGKELIHTIIDLPSPEICQMSIVTSARLCVAIAYIPTAVMTLLNLITSIANSSTESQVQAVINMADYPNLATKLANALEPRFEGLSAAERETDVVESLCSKMQLLARCYPYQVRNIIGSAFPQAVSRDMTTVDVRPNEVPITPQAWPSIYGEVDDMLPVDDVQWDSILKDLIGVS